MLFTTPDGSAVDITCNTWKCARIPKVASKSQVRGQPYPTIEILLVSGKNYRSMTHHLATIHERDQPTANQPT